MEEKSDYYAILNVPVGASADQIERAHRLLARMSHPDAFPNDPRGQAWANERMKQINEAHSVLRDPVSRAEYDRTRSPQQGPEARGDRGAHPQQTEPQVSCPLCEKHGRVPCLTCQGRGDASCPGCHGQQLVFCPACRGAGWLTETEYERLREDVERAEQQSAAQSPAQDPFWQVGYWNRSSSQSLPLGRPQTALMLSFFIPGAGQFYNREPQKGLTYLGIAFALFVGIGLLKGVGLLLWVGFWAYNLYDAYSTANRAA